MLKIIYVLNYLIIFTILSTPTFDNVINNKILQSVIAFKDDVIAVEEMGIQEFKQKQILSKIYKANIVDNKIMELNYNQKNNTLCLALNIYNEARGSSVDDMIATSMTVFSRANDKKYANINSRNVVCDVVFAKRQYSWTNVDEIKLPTEKAAWKKSQDLAFILMNDGQVKSRLKDINYKHYVSTKLYNSRSSTQWYKKATHKVVIGKHTYLVFDDINNLKEIKKMQRTINMVKMKLLAYNITNKRKA